MLLLRILVLGVVFSLALLNVSGLQPSTEANQTAEPVPIALRIPQALVDATVEPLRILEGGVPENPTGLWTVGRYDTSPLNTPGMQFFYGWSEFANAQSGVFQYLGQSQPGQQVIVTGSDGLNYVYEVDSVEIVPNDAPLAEVFASPAGAGYWLLLMSNATYDPALGPFSGVLVVKAIRSPDDVPAAPISTPETSTGQEICPGLALLPAQSLYLDSASLSLPNGVPTRLRTINVLNEILLEIPDCGVGVKAAVTLPDGNVLALAGPEGVVPQEALIGAVDASNGTILDSQRATLYSFVLFVQEGSVWNAYLPPAA